ncbi:hypothetical protein FA13DRAFT_1728678 [Coprinellus micaceus]|uniref:Uncharacterized protein n=1 Tax=Coprinellus micaceus TaxID=71717 RepID=A0A4Y7TPC5_COPMI|nr:hypothetical protein FA13DRAFT_1728678 [Coprinellus micaceus]
MSSTASTTSTIRPRHPQLQDPPKDTQRRIPVTPAVLRSIFASSRSPHEERSISRIAFFRFAGFLLSVVGISFFAARNRGFTNSAALLGVV